MYSDPSIPRLAVRAGHFATATTAMCTLLLASPSRARASDAGCTALMTAAKLQAKTPFHATYTVAPKTSGAFPTEHQEEIWINGTMYLTLGDKSWHRSPMPENPMESFASPIEGFSQCHPLPAMSIRGEATTGYGVTPESGRTAQIWISSKSGLPVHEIFDQDILLVTMDFDYANVRAPVLK